MFARANIKINFLALPELGRGIASSRERTHIIRFLLLSELGRGIVGVRELVYPAKRKLAGRRGRRRKP